MTLARFESGIRFGAFTWRDREGCDAQSKSRGRKPWHTPTVSKFHCALALGWKRPKREPTPGRCVSAEIHSGSLELGLELTVTRIAGLTIFVPHPLNAAPTECCFSRGIAVAFRSASPRAHVAYIRILPSSDQRHATSKRHPNLGPKQSLSLTLLWLTTATTARSGRIDHERAEGANLDCADGWPTRGAKMTSRIWGHLMTSPR